MNMLFIGSVVVSLFVRSEAAFSILSNFDLKLNASPPFTTNFDEKLTASISSSSSSMVHACASVSNP